MEVFTMGKPKIVIVGGVAGGASAAAKARRCSEDAEIIMFEKGPDIAYASCGLPYYLSGVIEDRDNLLIITKERFRRRFRVDVRTQREVIKIDRKRKAVTIRNVETGTIGEESYDRLILAPGSLPVIPPLPGVDLPFVFTFKTLEDMDLLCQYLQQKHPHEALIIGGGLIGMEVMENLMLKGLKVSIVEKLDQILPFLDWDMAELVRQHAETKGVRVHLAQGLKAIENRNGSGVVHTEGGKTLKADLVILSLGVKPNVALAREAGLEIGETSGIKVNEFMQTSDPDILAAGDCVECIHRVTGEPFLTPMGSVANKQGRAAGANALGRKIVVKGFLGTVILKVFDLTIAKTGLSEWEAQRAGFDPLVTLIHPRHIAAYYPGAKPLHMKTISDRASGRLLGSQVIGEEGVDKRIDVLATAIYHRMPLDELLQLDLAYAPPYSGARDPVVIAGAIGQNFFEGDWIPITPTGLKEKIESRGDFTLIDVRSKRECLQEGMIPGAIHIRLDRLRDHIDQLNKDRETVLYCRTGLRSYLATRILMMKGFTRVKNLTGGIMSWVYPLKKTETSGVKQ
jgi:NADPH-dependent 2,4-dienoyl-CoA reductase/sulfur reductase-like enzyme/rhodanese-related sulfurtransferase